MDKFHYRYDEYVSLVKFYYSVIQLLKLFIYPRLSFPVATLVDKSKEQKVTLNLTIQGH